MRQAGISNQRCGIARPEYGLFDQGQGILGDLLGDGGLTRALARVLFHHDDGESRGAVALAKGIIGGE